MATKNLSAITPGNAQPGTFSLKTCKHELKLKQDQCKYCRKCFKIRNNLIAHMKEAHKDIPQGTCLPCNKKPFVMRTKKNTEVRKCETCVKTFSSWSNYDLHMKSHTGEKPRD